MVMEIVGNALADYDDDELEEVLGHGAYTDILGDDDDYDDEEEEEELVGEEYDDDDDDDDDDEEEILGAEDLIGLGLPKSLRRLRKKIRPKHLALLHPAGAAALTALALRKAYLRKRKRRKKRKKKGMGPRTVAKIVRAALAKQQSAKMVQGLIAKKAIQQGQLVTTREPTRSREYPLGFDTVGTVAAGATVDVITRPQVVFRIDRFVVPASIAASFLIVDIKVGKNSQFVASAAVPAEVFSNTSFGVRLKGDTAQISQDVLLRVTNISGGALRFFAAIIGPALE